MRRRQIYGTGRLCCRNSRAMHPCCSGYLLFGNTVSVCISLCVLCCFFYSYTSRVERSHFLYVLLRSDPWVDPRCTKAPTFETLSFVPSILGSQCQLSNPVQNPLLSVSFMLRLYNRPSTFCQLLLPHSHRRLRRATIRSDFLILGISICYFI